MIFNWRCLDPTQMQSFSCYLHFCQKPCSLFWKQILVSPSLQHVIWYTVLQYETIFPHCIAIAIWEDFVQAQCHSNLISSHLLREISFFYHFVWRCKTNRLPWVTSSIAVHTLFWNLYNLVVKTWQYNHCFICHLFIFLLVTALVLSPTMISCISTMGRTAALIWLAVSKIASYLRRLRAHPTSCT